jgi:leucyl aminopeptidase
MPPEIVLSEEDPTTVACDALLVGAVAGADGPALAGRGEHVDRALSGSLSRYLDAAAFRGARGELEIVGASDGVSAASVAVVGLGEAAEVATGTLRAAAGAAARRLAGRTVIASLLHDGADLEGAAGATVEGFLLGSYRFLKYKSDAATSKLERVLVLGGSAGEDVARAQVGAEATLLARDLVNEPASTLTPTTLATRAVEVADVAGLESSVLDADALTARGFGGLLSVSKGSAEPPCLIRLHHAPEEARGRVALVGKGITFDSGGLSIKDARAMETMKTDMAGAAAVIAACGAAGRLSLPVEVVGIVPTCENMPGGHALRPGDVIRHYGGRTTEVNNTDAEGRLILGDALALASEEKPDAIVDLATLTGAIIIALGQRSTGLFTNDDALAEELRVAGTAAGERLWRMPLYGDYLSALDSPVADVKNSAGREGSSINAALFLQEFVGRGIPWAHLDIAGSARSDKERDEVARGGTGTGARTLIEWLRRRAR